MSEPNSMVPTSLHPARMWHTRKRPLAIMDAHRVRFPYTSPRMFWRTLTALKTPICNRNSAVFVCKT